MSKLQSISGKASANHCCRGKRRTLSLHRLNEPHPEVTNPHIAYVLANWVVKGVFTGDDGEQSLRYYGFVPGVRAMVRVAVSADDARILTAFRDSQATRHWKRGNLAYFANKLEAMEAKDETRF